MDIRTLLRKDVRDLAAFGREIGVQTGPDTAREALLFEVMCTLFARTGVPEMSVEGVIDIEQARDGTKTGYLRHQHENYLASIDDIVVPDDLLRGHGLATGDMVRGTISGPPTADMRFALSAVTAVNGRPPITSRHRRQFRNLTPVHPSQQLRFERPGAASPRRVADIGRIIDLMAPIGRGQRALITAPPRVGKTVMLKEMARAIEDNHPDVELMVLLIDERPEEVTEFQESIKSEVMFSTFDEAPEQHIAVADMVMEKAKRLVEFGRDVVILLDSITRLARAHNAIMPQGGRALSGGLDANALQRPKRFFGNARAFKEGGSLTIIATALIETGSRMEEVIFEEFKGTGNAEIVLDRRIAERRIFPAIDVMKSGTRQDHLFFDADIYRRLELLRRGVARVGGSVGLGAGAEATEKLLDLFKQYRTNAELLDKMQVAVTG